MLFKYSIRVGFWFFFHILKFYDNTEIKFLTFAI